MTGADVPGSDVLTIRLGDAALEGELTVPADAVGVVVFAHGSGSSRLSPRNRAVARTLNEAGLATLLFDLLTEDESLDRAHVFDVELLGHRLSEVVDWTRDRDDVGTLPVGLFGASTGAAAALEAAVDRSDVVAAVVSRGGRPDLATRLAEVAAPVLLVVGGDDQAVLEMNRGAARYLTVPHEITVVPGAGHLFEGPGQLEQVATDACEWFLSHLTA